MMIGRWPITGKDAAPRFDGLIIDTVGREVEAADQHHDTDHPQAAENPWSRP